VHASRSVRGAVTRPASRIGVTRFGVVLTETNENAAINFVERVREAVPRSIPRHGDGLRFSFGWASPERREPANALVRGAERRLAAELMRRERAAQG
jgi:GGDEF domain-containing protein